MVTGAEQIRRVNSYEDVKHMNKKPVDLRLNCENSISKSCVMFEGSNFIMNYNKGFFGEEIAEPFYNHKYPKSARLSGIGSNSEIFGYAPRDFIKGFPGRMCKFNTNNQKAYQILLGLGHIITKFYKDKLPEQFEQHKKALEQIPECWRMPGTVFTSGIINCSNKLIYHTDNGNMPGCYSAMVTFRRNVSGGYLHLPEFDAIIKNESGSLLIFDGAKVLHGVTPFIGKKKDFKRITIVFYVLKNLKTCEDSYKKEIETFNQKIWESSYAKNRDRKQAK